MDIYHFQDSNERWTGAFKSAFEKIHFNIKQLFTTGGFMRKLHWIAVPLIIALSACSTNYYAFDGDYNGKKFDGEFSEDEILIKKEMFNDTILVENFSSQELAKGMSGYIRPDIIDGELKSVSSKDGVGNTLNYENPDGFESVTVCWKRTSAQGHLILWVTVPGFGMPTFFNDSNGYSAHIHLDSLGGYTEPLGHKDTASSWYIVQEVRIDGDKILLLANGVLFNTYKMDMPRKFTTFAIGNNGGGAGVIDYIIIK